MTNIEKSRLSAEEIRLIIQACAESAVASLKFGDLEVVFQPKSGWERQTSPIPAAPSSGTEIPDAQLTKLAQETLEKEELDLRQEQVEYMPIENPLEYEEMLARGELEDVVSG